MKHIFTFIGLCTCILVNAQNSTDVLRYSIDNTQGTARYQSMGGAFGALGGDLSALQNNPAGSAVFNHSLFTVSGTAYQTDNTSNYFNTTNESQENSSDINQIGGVLILKSSQKSDWKKIALAINYEVNNNFQNNIYTTGRSNQGIDSYFLDFAQGVPFGDIQLQDRVVIQNGEEIIEKEYLEDAYLDIGANQGFGDQQTFLGYFGGIIDPVNETDENTDYSSNANYTSVNQQQTKNTLGYNSKFTVNFASQYQENLYIGASVNLHDVLYEEYNQFTETGYNTTSPIQRTTLDSFLRTVGGGVSLNVGAIAKLNQNVRIGGSYQSPTWYRLTDEFSQRIDSDLADQDISFINFNVINLFETYTIKTPSKLTGSLALIFGKEGLLSLDYSRQDMSQAQLKPLNDPTFSNENNQISTNLQAVSSLKIGGEYRISRVSLRAGYRYNQSPYKDRNIAGNLKGYSAGIGYNFGGSKLDFALNKTEQDYSEQLFTTGLTTPAMINRIQTNATLSYTLNF